MRGNIKITVLLMRSRCHSSRWKLIRRMTWASSSRWMKMTPMEHSNQKWMTVVKMDNPSLVMLECLRLKMLTMVK